MLSNSQIEALKQFDTPTVCNAIECFNIQSRNEGFMFPGLSLRTDNSEPMVGYAATVKISGAESCAKAYDNQMGYYAYAREMDKPSIAVVQDIDTNQISSFWGEVQATTHLALGFAGTITDGGVRDIPDVNKTGFKMYATKIDVAHGYVHVVEYGTPLTILGLTIHSGDLLHVDQHGAVIIPEQLASKLAKCCSLIAKAELPMLVPCREAIEEGRIPSMEEIKSWRKAMDEARKNVVQCL